MVRVQQRICPRQSGRRQLVTSRSATSAPASSHPNARRGAAIATSLPVRSPDFCRLALLFSFIVSASIGTLSPTQPGFAEAVGAARPLNILVINSYNQDIPWQKSFERGLKAGLQAELREFQLFMEYLDAGRLAENSRSSALKHHLEAKYRQVQIDVVVTESHPAMRFLSAHPELFPDAKRLYVQPGDTTGMKGAASSAAITVGDDYGAAIAEMQSLVGPKKVYVIADASTQSRMQRLEAFKAVVERRRPDFETEYLVDLPIADLLERTADLPQGSALFYLLIFQDGAGQTFAPYQAAQLITERANAPMFSNWETLMGSGIVGGYLLSGERLGNIAARSAAALSQDRPVTYTNESGYGYYYDWRQLQRWNIAESLLPERAQVMFYQPTVIQKYRWQIISVISALSLMALLSIVLLLLNLRLRRAETKLTKQNERFDAALEHMSQGVSMFDENQRFVTCNQRYASMYGLPRELLKVGTPFREILKHRVDNKLFAGDDPNRYIDERCKVAHERESGLIVQELHDGRKIALSHQPMPGGGWIATHEDITELWNFEVRMAHMAHHDTLTDLPNRALLRERMEEELKRTLRGASFSLMYLDLDGFKGVNDTLGHPVGDGLLKAVAERLTDCVRDVDTVARLGGDEFAIVQTSIGEPEDVSVLAQRVCSKIAEPFAIDEHEVVVGTSIGIVVAPRDGSDPDELMKKVDMALYEAKRDGRGRYCFFSPEMEKSTNDRHALGLDLRRALAHGELVLRYQPLINLETSRITGFEALLRWRHSERGMVTPEQFIPIAEELGLIGPIGEWVLNEACREAATWPRNVRVAVNVSPTQFRGDQLVPAVKAALATAGLEPGRLELEITETVLLRDEDATIAILHELRRLGVRISLDDFGTGYSSLSYLQSFPFDKIKIDASFISRLGQEDDGIGIVHAVTSIAARLGVATTAEGVETEEQLAILREEGCTEVQGHLFGPPCPPSDLSRLLLHGAAQKIRAA